MKMKMVEVFFRPFSTVLIPHGSAHAMETIVLRRVAEAAPPRLRIGGQGIAGGGSATQWPTSEPLRCHIRGDLAPLRPAR
jgi:hypothetical protein